MARLRPTSTPTEAEDRRRRQWVAGTIRMEGVRLLPEARHMEWAIAWRRWDAGLGPLPVSADMFEAAMKVWPDRFVIRAALSIDKGWRK